MFVMCALHTVANLPVWLCGDCCRHNAKSGKCAVCEQATSGIFNVAHDVLKKMKKLKGN